MRVAFFATVSPADEPRVQTMFGYALAARTMDAEVLVFLALDGGLLARKKVIDNLLPATKNRILEAMKEGVALKICSDAAHTYGITKEEMLDGVDIWGIVSFLDYASQADVSLSW